MSFASGNPSSEAVQTFLEVLQNDFRTLANETKKKYPQIKEVCSHIRHILPFHFCRNNNLNVFLSLS